jgi:ATP-dependent Clp protease ATP-binding subunit ClpA|nr:AAA family ATPase [Neorhizobium tomejilense]
MISSELQQFIDSANDYAGTLRERTTSLVHILLAVLDDGQLQDVLHRCGVSYLDIRQGAIDALALRLDDPSVRNQPSEGLSALSLYAIQAAQQKASVRNAEWAGVLDFIAAVLEIHDNGSFDFQARVILSDAGLSVSTFAKARGSSRPGSVTTHESVVSFGRKAEAMLAGGERQASGYVGDEKTAVTGLLPFCTDMTALAREGMYDRSYGRESILSGLQVVLGRRKKRSAVLIGDPGVGKTSIVEELACRIAEGAAGARLARSRIISLDIGSLVGGTKYRGELEERVKALVRQLTDDPDAILFVDEVHTLVSPTHSAGVAADLLKPALASGAIRCIGATTLAEYKKYFESDAAMARRFAGLNVPEPTRDEAVSLLERAAPAYADFHGVNFPEWAFETAVDLSMRLMPERRLPDKALELLDDAAARASLSGLPDVTRELFEQCARTMSGKTDAPGDTAAAVGRLPPPLASAARAVQRNAIAGDAFRQTVAFIGQRPAQIKDAVKAVSAALSRPYEYLDMSEYGEATSVSALLGPPPGYVGYDNGGRLYDAVRRSPDCVLHLANIEQCHPTALTILQECLEAGFVRDTTGRIASVARVQFVVSMKQKPTRGTIGFAAHGDGYDTEYGVELVDNAETIVVLGGEGDATSVASFLEDLISTARSLGVSMSLGEGIVEEVESMLKSSGRDWKRKYSRLVRQPVLDYLVSRRLDFTLEAAEAGIRIRTHEA